MTQHRQGDLYARHKKLPDGFTRYKNGSGCPVDASAFVELMIRTAEGAGSSGVRRALYVDWDQGEPGGLGQVVGYRLAHLPKAQS